MFKAVSKKNIWMGKEVIKVILTRAIVLYLFLFCLSSLVVDYKKIRFQTRLREINATMPRNFGYLLDLAEGRATPDITYLKNYLVFYSRIVLYFPDQADAQAMLGFCFYQIGLEDKAAQYYQQAIKLAPDVFWFYHNLGVIYFKQSKLKEAGELFQKAVSLDPKNTTAFIHNSHVVYQTLLMSDPASDKELNQRLSDAYDHGYQLSILSFYYLRDFGRMGEMAQKALGKVQQNQDVFYFYAGMADYQKKEYEKAEKYFRKASQVNPNFSDALRYLALSLQFLERKEEAKRVFDQISLIKNPSRFSEQSLLPADKKFFFPYLNLKIF